MIRHRIKKLLARGGKDELFLFSWCLYGILLLALVGYILIGIATIEKTGKTEEKKQPEDLPGNETLSEETESDVTEPSGTSPEDETLPEETEPAAGPTAPTAYNPPSTRYDIHALSPERVNEIAAMVDGTVRGFGINLTPVLGDDGRPFEANDMLERFSGIGVVPVMYCGNPGDKVVAFSFQAGMENGHTENILNILSQYQVPGTFYITKYFAEKAPDLVRRMVNDGHTIGSHSYRCPDEGIATWPLQDQMDDAMKLQDYMLTNFGYSMGRYNYNSGAWSLASAKMLSEMGYQIDFCSMNYADYFVDKFYDNVETLHLLKEGLHDGCIYCFHMTNVITEQILPELIEYCRAQGYTIIAVP